MRWRKKWLKIFSSLYYTNFTAAKVWQENEKNYSVIHMNWSVFPKYHPGNSLSINTLAYLTNIREFRRIHLAYNFFYQHRPSVNCTISCRTVLFPMSKIVINQLFLYCVGVIPVSFLKNRQKNESVGKLSVSLISATEAPVSLSNTFASVITALLIHSDTVLPLVNDTALLRYCGVTHSKSA